MFLLVKLGNRARRQFQNKSSALGNSNGSYGMKKYFSCEAHCGVFVNASQIMPYQTQARQSTRRTPNNMSDNQSLTSLELNRSLEGLRIQDVPGYAQVYRPNNYGKHFRLSIKSVFSLVSLKITSVCPKCGFVHVQLFGRVAHFLSEEKATREREQRPFLRPALLELFFGRP